MKIVGTTTYLGSMIPFEITIDRPAVMGDIVRYDDEYYRVYYNGGRLAFFNVTQKWEQIQHEYIPSGSEMDVKGMGW